MTVFLSQCSKFQPSLYAVRDRRIENYIYFSLSLSLSLSELSFPRSSVSTSLKIKIWVFKVRITSQSRNKRIVNNSIQNTCDLPPMYEALLTEDCNRDCKGHSVSNAFLTILNPSWVLNLMQIQSFTDLISRINKILLVLTVLIK
jgi:hypothetical protein